MNNNIIFSICARGGSKGLPNKNISDFMGRPLITTTIEQARKSKYCNDIYVSTDSHKILEVAKKAEQNIFNFVHLIFPMIMLQNLMFGKIIYKQLNSL